MSSWKELWEKTAKVFNHRGCSPSAEHLIVAMTHRSEQVQVQVQRVTLTVFLGGVDSVKQGSAVASAFRQKYSSVWIWQDNCPGPLVAITALIPRLCASGRGNFLTWLNCFGLISPNGKKWVKWSCQGLLRAVIEVWTQAFLWTLVWVPQPPKWFFSATETMHSYCLTRQSVVYHTVILPDSLHWKKNKKKTNTAIFSLISC